MDQKNSEKKQSRRLLGTGVGIFVVALGGLGGFSYLQRQAVQSEAPTSQRSVSSQTFSIPDISPERKAEYVERARYLRAKMEPWARSHQAELRRMLKAGPEDAAARDAVWQLVPVDPTSMGFTPKELVPTGDPTTGIGFGWAGLGKANSKVTDPTRQVMVQKIRGLTQTTLERDFRGRRDITLSVGYQGLTRTYLWVSGRITQATRLSPEEYVKKARRFRIEGRPFGTADMQGPIQEIVPPYDFLR